MDAIFKLKTLKGNTIPLNKIATLIQFEIQTLTVRGAKSCCDFPA